MGNRHICLPFASAALYRESGHAHSGDEGVGLPGHPGHDVGGGVRESVGYTIDRDEQEVPSGGV